MTADPHGEPKAIPLSQIIAAVLACDPAAEAIEYHGRWCCWGDLSVAIADVRAQIDQLGIGPGERVGILLRNRPSQLTAALALLAGEYCLVTINPIYPDATLSSDIAGLGLPVILGEAADLEREGVLAAAVSAGSGVVRLGAWPGEPCALLRFRAHAPVTDSGAAIEMLSSGTTGKPKRVPLARDRFRRALIPAVEQEASENGRFVARLRPGCRILVAPLTHIGGIWGMLRGVIAGRRLALLEKFTLPEWLEAVRRHRPVSVALTPAGLKMILDAGVPKDDLASIRAIAAGTAPTDPAIVDAFLEHYGVPVLVNYGATEFGGPVANWSLPDFRARWASKRGSVGRLYPGIEARTIDPGKGTVLPPGAEGTLELRGPQLPDPTAWLRTTDRAIVDEDRFLWITGRNDAAIIRGGFKVHPEDVVTALESHAMVREAVVVGLPDARLGQVPAAVIILAQGARFDEQALLAHLRACLLPYQLPVRILPVEDFPRTAAMKPALVALRAMLEGGNA